MTKLELLENVRQAAIPLNKAVNDILEAFKADNELFSVELIHLMIEMEYKTASLMKKR
jgi:hypothetical protein